ncbi:hypothetical protein I302_103213 [Kwoniella bestiolae CBS 10118]|uniref:Uncharacterized protein n=1 Tax=Kwoniella bestiolae CBS 10118 TaxID=1296100 RepID=A0A1B9G7R7_9TREE|nr:hypothetical protein I302_01912 [Kwoniella bestiolae CBS 10118]OCF27077.1 hypothetical protein I302_01912 [Kwoniella bestiolae CBS 10118]
MSSDTASHNFDIIPADFQKLHPVHYHIFDILKKEVPITLIQTCREVYDELIPKIYERLTITGNNYDSITGGVNIELEDCFTNPSGAVQFICDTHFCDGGCCDDNPYLLKRNIFPNIQQLHLGKKIVHLLAEVFVYEREGWDPSDISYHRIDELLDIIFAGREPHTICIDWPDDWSKDGWGEDDETDDGDSEDWALERGMKNLLLEFANFDCVKHIIVHLQSSKLQHVQSKLNRITNNADLILYVEDSTITNKDSSKSAMIEEVWDHFESLCEQYDIDYIPVRYSIPHSPWLPSSIESLHEGLGEEDVELFHTLKERLEIRDRDCGCKLK